MEVLFRMLTLARSSQRLVFAVKAVGGTGRRGQPAEARTHPQQLQGLGLRCMKESGQGVGPYSPSSPPWLPVPHHAGYLLGSCCRDGILSKALGLLACIFCMRCPASSFLDR